MKKKLIIFVPFIIAIVAIVGFLKGEVAPQDALQKVTSAFNGSENEADNTMSDDAKVDEAINAVKSLVSGGNEVTAEEVQEDAADISEKAQEVQQDAAEIEEKAAMLEEQKAAIDAGARSNLQEAADNVSNKMDNASDAIKNTSDSIGNAMDAVKSSAQGLTNAVEGN